MGRSDDAVRVAAFDCGTNSLRLLVADVDPDADTMTEIVREMRIVRLGQGVDRTGRLAQPALKRTFDALEEFCELARSHDVERLRLCATSAARDAENAEEFVRGVRERMDVDPVVLDGEAEARASYLGATRALATPLDQPYLVVDIGGGSTELILGEGDQVLAAESLDIGSVRLAERRLVTDPPAEDEIEAIRRDVADALARCSVEVGRAGTVIGVAGTITTIAAGALGLESYDREVIHHALIGLEELKGVVATMLRLDVDQRRSLGYMHPGRADVIGAGGLVLEGILDQTTVDAVLVSEHDILDGIAWTLATEQGS